MDRKVQLVCAWSGPVFLVAFVVGFWFIAGLVPPPSPTHTALQIAHFYQVHATRIRIGVLISMMATALMAPFLALLTLQMKRSNPKLAPLAYTQLICGVALLIFVLLPLALVAVAAYRPHRLPVDEIRLLNDTAFIILFWVFSTPTLEYFAVGAFSLLDSGDRPLFPRWVGWFDILVGLIFATGAPVAFVKRGIFAWDGTLAFWAVLLSFGAWILVTFWYLRKAVEWTLPD